MSSSDCNDGRPSKSNDDGIICEMNDMLQNISTAMIRKISYQYVQIVARRVVMSITYVTNVNK